MYDVQQTYLYEVPYNQPERERFVSSMRKVLGFECTVQTGKRGFETLEGSVLDKAQYNQAYKVMDQLHTNKKNGFFEETEMKNIHFILF